MKQQHHLQLLRRSLRTIACALLLLGYATSYAQTEPSATRKWEAGLRVNSLYFAGNALRIDEANLVQEGGSYIGNLSLAATYRPTEKRFFRFALGTNWSLNRIKTFQIDPNELQNDRRHDMLSITSMVSMGHTFAAPKHARLRRFRLSTGLNLHHSSTVYSNSYNRAYGRDSFGNTVTVEGISTDTYSHSLGLLAFGLLEMRIAERLHIGLEFQYGVYGHLINSEDIGPGLNTGRKYTSATISTPTKPLLPILTLNLSL
ncbi:MAG: hypothetical protein U0176_11350 [Bacteroidia bacterium]